MHALRSLGTTHRLRPAKSRLCTSAKAQRVLILGGSGFVGQELCKQCHASGLEVTSISRRGQGAGKNVPVEHIKGDLISDSGLVRDVLRREPPFAAVIHAVGMLLPNEFNSWASGSGSKPAPGTTFDQITRQTALNAAEALAERSPGAPFCFVSAAEAAWNPDPFFLPDFMRQYLAAKRAVEARLLEMTLAGTIRAVIARPSLIWTPERPAAIPSVAAFAAANAIGIPGIDRPVRVETLARALVLAVQDSKVSGILDYRAMEALVSSARS